MLLFRILKNVNKREKFNLKNVGFLSTAVTSENTAKEIKRKYLKEIHPQEVQPWRGSYFLNLFAGIIDKKVFDYPAILSGDGFETVLNQSVAVESFISRNKNCKLTNDIIQQLRELELFGLSVPQEFGGAGYSETETKFLIECTGCSPKIARFLGYQEDFGCRLINRYGTPEQKYKYLQDLAGGKRFMSLAYLENHFLIDLSKQEGEASCDYENKNYILKAEKKWVHHADKADLFLVFAKCGTCNKENFEYEIKFNMFLVDKTAPGVTVHKLKSPRASDAEFFEVSFENVLVPMSNVLGGPEGNGFDILKHGLCHSNLTDVTLCLSLMKQMFHDALQYVEEKSLKSSNTRGHLYVRESISTFTIYIYALESVLYLLTASLDKYDKPDLFHDTIMGKILGIDFLRLGIQFYTEIVGRDSFRKTEVIEEAFNAVQYNTVFEDNIENFKLMSAAEGLVFVSQQLAKKVKVLRNQFDNPFEALKIRALNILHEKKFKSDLNLRMELHASMSGAADLIEQNLLEFNYIIQSLYLQHGALAIYCEHAITILAETASYLFAAIACASRSSSSTCYDINNFENEKLAAEIFIKFADIKIHKIFEEKQFFSEIIEAYRLIGENAFNYKEYPMQHPLTRAY